MARKATDHILEGPVIRPANRRMEPSRAELWTRAAHARSLGRQIRKTRMNSANDIERRLSEIGREIKGLCSRGELLCRQFSAASQAFVINWCRQRVEATVIGQPMVTKAHGVTRVRELKNELETLCRGFTGFANRLMGERELWFHRQEPLPASYDSWHGPFFGERITDALNTADDLLKRFGYSPGASEKSWRVWPREMEQIRTQHTDVCVAIGKLLVEQTSLREAKHRIEAENVWRQA